MITIMRENHSLDGKCPRCDNKDGICIEINRNPKVEYDHAGHTKDYIVSFECPHCFYLFWQHTTHSAVEYWQIKIKEDKKRMV